MEEEEEQVGMKKEKEGNKKVWAFPAVRGDDEGNDA